MEKGELLASRSFWLYLLAVGPLVGQAFLHAASLYAEAALQPDRTKPCG